MNKPKQEINNLPEYDYLKPASTQDCTGLIPAGPVDENEMDQYEELYSFLPPVFSTHTGAEDECTNISKHQK